MGLPNAPTAYTDVRRRWRVPVRHSAASAAWRRPRLPQWSWAAADLDRAAKECRNLLGADATKSARPSSIIQIDRSLTAKAGRLGLKVPKLKGEVFESAVIERHRRREESVDPPLSRQVPAR